MVYEFDNKKVIKNQHLKCIINEILYMKLIVVFINIMTLKKG